MNLSRREAIKRTFLGAIGSRLAYATILAGVALFEVGCSVFSDVLAWIPVGEAALNSILAVLTGNGVAISPAIQSIVSLIEAGFAALTAAVKEYQSTTPAPVGALAKVETAFKDIVDNFSTFLQSLNVSGGLLGIITGLAQVVLSTIAAFVNRLPASMAMKSVSDKVSRTTISGNVIVVTPKKRSVGAFKGDFNTVLKTAPADVKVPTNAYLQ
jgi:hypothetical protein